MKRSNLIPITRIYDIYPKYTFSNDVKRFMDEIVDIDRANVYTKDEVITMFTELKKEIAKLKSYESEDGQDLVMLADIGIFFNQKIDALKENKDEER